MKIDKEKVYEIQLSGHQIKLMQYLLTNADLYETLSEQGKKISKVLYDSLEEDVKEINSKKGIKQREKAREYLLKKAKNEKLQKYSEVIDDSIKSNPWEDKSVKLDCYLN